ncbi:hypothetical protein, partial [Pseudoalteromonas sp.]|uniref:hypothetical protein n=1 Tax=Pseudoalteromonas sp. TaxID=53249 RepID=UPI00262EB64F
MYSNHFNYARFYGANSIYKSPVLLYGTYLGILTCTKVAFMITGKGRFDAYRGPQDGEQAGPSHGGWPTLQQSAGVAGVKCTAPSQLPKKTA